MSARGKLYKPIAVQGVKFDSSGTKGELKCHRSHDLQGDYTLEIEKDGTPPCEITIQTADAGARQSDKGLLTYQFTCKPK